MRLAYSYSDNNFSVSTAPVGGTAPTLKTDFLGSGYRAKSFAVNDLIYFDDIEQDHSYDELFPTIYWHLHFTPYDAVANGTYKAQFEIKFRYTNAAGVWQAEQTVTFEATWTETGNNGTRVTWTKVDVGDATGVTITGANIASIFAGSVKRIAASGSEFSGGVCIHRAGFHFRQNSVGSENVSSK